MEKAEEVFLSMNWTTTMWVCQRIFFFINLSKNIYGYKIYSYYTYIKTFDVCQSHLFLVTCDLNPFHWEYLSRHSDSSNGKEEPGEKVSTG